jgi:hypothetical protein
MGRVSSAPSVCSVVHPPNAHSSVEGGDFRGANADCRLSDSLFDVEGWTLAVWRFGLRILRLILGFGFWISGSPAGHAGKGLEAADNSTAEGAKSGQAPSIPQRRRCD